MRRYAMPALIMAALSLVAWVLLAVIADGNRITRLEAEHLSTRDAIERVERKVDRIDQKVDRLLERR